MPRQIRAESHPIQVRKANLSLVAQAAMNRPQPFTRADLVRDTALSMPTVASLVAELVEVGLLREMGTRRASAGRSPSLIEFNARFGFLVGIDIGRFRTRLAITDLRRDLLTQRVITSPSSDLPAADVLKKTAEHVYDLLANHQIASDRLLAAGVSVPGVVNEDTGVIVRAPGLKGWNDVPAGEILQGILRSDVVVSNDVHRSVVAEHARGAARGHARCVFISAGHDVTAAVLNNGRLDRGHSFMAGQIRSMWIPRTGAREGSGSFGMFSPLTDVMEKVPTGEDPAAWMGRMSDAAERGDLEARTVLLDLTRAVAVAVTNVVSIVDPSIVVLGGPLFSHAPRLVASAAAVVQGSWPGPLEIAASSLGEEASLWGAVIAAHKAARLKLRRELWPQWTAPAADSILDSE